MERLYVLSLAYSLILAVAYGVEQLNLNLMVLFSSALFPTTAAIVAVFFSLALLVSLVFPGGNLDKPWFFPTLGVILKIPADWFLYNAEFRGFYYQRHPFELLWLWSYVAVMMGLLIHMREF